MKLQIQSPNGIEIAMDSVQAIRTRLIDGKPLTLMPSHAPLMGEIGNQTITVVSNHHERSFHVSSGVLYIADDVVEC